MAQAKAADVAGERGSVESIARVWGEAIEMNREACMAKARAQAAYAALFDDSGQASQPHREAAARVTAALIRVGLTEQLCRYWHAVYDKANAQASGS